MFMKNLYEIKFHDYENFDNVNGAYINFIQKKSSKNLGFLWTKRFIK